MSIGGMVLKEPPQLEDALSHLPIGNTANYTKGQIIYGPNHPSHSIHLVVSGTVAISQISEQGNDVLLEIIRPHELFGESAFLDVARRSDRAQALEKVESMFWTVPALEDLVMRRPRLAIALLQVLAQRNADLAWRIESFSLDIIERRLARSLIRFSQRLGVPEQDGSVRMMAFTHEMLSRYVGTSREMITQYMTRFRRQGYISYSRRGGIVLHRDSLQSMLAEKNRGLPA